MARALMDARGVRSSRPLDGVWEARLDPLDAGLSQQWSLADTVFDLRLRVPLAWQAADASLRGYAGAVWYRTRFQLPDEWRGQDLAVHFGAVDYHAQVWLNGHAVGEHTGGYTPFELDFSARARWGTDNLLVLRVFDPPSMDEIPHGKQGPPWYSPVSGPWQPVSVLARPARRIERLRCTPDVAHSSLRIRATCRLATEGAPAEIELTALDPDTRTPIARAKAAASSVDVELRIREPKLWSPDTPALYSIRAELRADGQILDVLEEQVGLRSFEVRGGRLLLNGQPFSMRGALDQGYWPDTLYTPPSDAEIEREIRLAKQMGLNLLRKHVKPEDPRYLDACDRLGMLVWAEPANPNVFTQAARDALRRDLLEMIERDFNRPSVVIWSLYNEDWGLPGLWSDPQCQAWLRELYAEVKAADPTRPICDNSGWAHVVTDLNDYHEYFALPDRTQQFRKRMDFIAGQPSDNYAQGCAPRGDEAVLISEWGNRAIADPDLARQRTSGEPTWFTRDRGTGARDPGEQIETIAGFEERFRQLHLDAIFGGVSELTEHIQRRAFRSVKAQIEDMRRRADVQGWVVTEFSDIEWEGNGWLDYWRQPKAFTNELAALNADIAVVAMPQQPNVWGGSAVVVPLWLSNRTPHPLTATLHWRLESTHLSGQAPTRVGAFELASLDAIRFEAPADLLGNQRLTIELRNDRGALARTHAELAFAPPDAALVRGTDANAYHLERLFRQRLERQGYRIPREFHDDIPVAITTVFDSRIKAFVDRGGQAVWLVGAEDPRGDQADLSFRALPPGESWHMAAGCGWANAQRLAPAPILPSLGWEVADCFPHLAIDSRSARADDEQLAGWFEGWLAKAGVFALRRQLGQGQVVVTTFRLADRYGLDPVATLLLNRLVTIALGH